MLIGTYHFIISINQNHDQFLVFHIKWPLSVSFQFVPSIDSVCLPLWKDYLFKMKWAFAWSRRKKTDFLTSLCEEQSTDYSFVDKLKHKLVSHFYVAANSCSHAKLFQFGFFFSSFFSLEKCFDFTKTLITTACYTPTVSIQSQQYWQ